MERQKRIAVINDFSGFGRCSLMVAVPIISAMKIQCCAMPTAVLSNHTGYEDYFFDDYTDKMEPYYKKWEKLNLRFDGIYSGFLGSVRQVGIVDDFIRTFNEKDTDIIIDPVMGDNGKQYATIDDDLCRELKKLIPLSTILTPNMTEACLLSGVPYRNRGVDEDELAEIVRRLRELGASKTVITGIFDGSEVCDYVTGEDGEGVLVRQKRLGTPHAGTGDVFASVIAADAVNGVDFLTSVKKAGSFVGKAMAVSNRMHVPTEDGVCFEEVLYELAR